MEYPITIRECTAPAETELFWNQLNLYFARDIYPQLPDWKPDPAYRAAIQALHDRHTDPVRYLLFWRGGRAIGLALTVVYAAEDGKQFILEFCVFPPFRGGGTGKACAAALLAWGRQQGAQFAELNCDTLRRQRFWASLGFALNGQDQWGTPLMLLAPQTHVPLTIQPLTDTGELFRLQNIFRAAVGEPPLTDAQKNRLEQAAAEGRITFLAALRLTRPVGVCSVSLYWSTFACAPAACFEDFYIEPAFRGQGAARLLASAARRWCAEHGCASLTVGCAACDEAMYQSLGFSARLGTLLAADLIP